MQQVASGVRIWRRVALAALLAASALLLTVAGQQDPADAACMAPALEIRPRAAAPGSSITIHGHAWKHGCNDTVDCPSGGPCPVDPNTQPRSGIALRFSQGRHHDSLGIVDADESGRFAFAATVPLWAKQGAATIMADDVPAGFSVSSMGAAGGGIAGVPLRDSLGAPDPGAGAGEAGALAKTGLDLPETLALAFLLIAAGATLRLLSLTPFPRPSA